MNIKIVELLEHMLLEARRGEIASIAIATVKPDLSTGSTFLLGDSSFCELVGSVSLLNHRLITSGFKSELD
jgi:hypothetical protein